MLVIDLTNKEMPKMCKSLGNEMRIFVQINYQSVFSMYSPKLYFNILFLRKYIQEIKLA